MASEKDLQQIKYEKQLQSLCEQVRTRTCQIEMLNEESDHTRSCYTAACRDLDDLKRELALRDDAIGMFESKMENLRFEFKESEKSSQRTVENLNNKLASCHDQLQKRESSLISCKNDAKCHEVSLEEVRADFLSELQQKDGCMIHIKEDLRRVCEELKCKSESTCLLQKIIADMKSRLHQTTAQFKDVENKTACVLEQIEQLECQATRDKNQFMKDMEEYDKKLNHSCNELCNCQNENRKMKRCLQDMDEKIQQFSAGINNLTRDLENTKTESCAHQDRAAGLENDNKEICRLLQQKVKCIKELETELCVKNEQLEQCGCCVEQLKETVRRKSNIELEKEDNTDLEKQLKVCKEKLKKTQEDLEECRKKLEWTVTELDNMAQEIKRLNCEMEEMRRQLAEKDSLIGDLERTIEHSEQDMENRLRRADEMLRRHEKEINDKTRMINECDERCCRYQKSLDDKEAELEQIDMQLSRANMEVNSLCNKIKDLEDARDCLQKKNNEQRAMNQDLCQDLKCTKDQIEVVSIEVGDTKRDLSCCQRELEKLRRESEELKLDLQEKDTCVSRLTEEKNSLSNKVSSLQCRIENETADLTQQMTDVRFRLESELEQMRIIQMQADETNAKLTKKLSAGQRKLAQLEKCFYQKVDTYTRDNQNLQAKIADKEDQLQAIKDTITLKDSELMRLKLRECPGDRSNNLNPGAECGPQMGCMNMTTTSVPEASGGRKRTRSWGGDNACCRPTNES
ncbi:hypothetical protein BsWGS_23201 [Bradybaena similaris]